MAAVPTDAELVALYSALACGDPTAPYDFACVLLPYLAAWLHAEFPRVSPDLCDEAASETAFALITGRQVFRPGGRMTLRGYLHMSARGDLRNGLRREKRHRHKDFDEERVELGGRRGNSSPAVLQILCVREDRGEQDGVLDALRAGLDAREAAAFDLLVAGERRSAAYAQALGLDQLSPPEQRAAIKRFKDRIKKRLSRRRQER